MPAGMRSEAKRKFFWKGLLPKIKTELWPRMKREENFNEICDLAYIAESIVINKELIDEKNPNNLIGNIKEEDKVKDSLYKAE